MKSLHGQAKELGLSHKCIQLRSYTRLLNRGVTQSSDIFERIKWVSVQDGFKNRKTGRQVNQVETYCNCRIKGSSAHFRGIKHLTGYVI